LLRINPKSLVKYASHVDNPISSNFAKHENLAKMKFLDSLTDKNTKKKSMITELKFVESRANVDNQIDNNVNKINPNDNKNSKDTAIEISKKSDFQNASIFEKKDSIKFQGNSHNYSKLYEAQSETPKWEKFLNLIKKKSIEIYENEELRTCLNPFRNDSDPTSRYCYYCLTATCCLIWFMLFYIAMST